MPFHPPPYTPPDFSQTHLRNAPLVNFQRVVTDGVLPENFHATSIFPEYFHLREGDWRILKDTRMDCAVVQDAGGLAVKEARNISSGVVA